MTHTPGPYTYSLEGEKMRVWAMNQKARPALQFGVADICINRSINNSGPSQEEKDTAALFAAAPDLLAVAEAVLENYQLFDFNFVTQARDAVNKAKGESNG